MRALGAGDSKMGSGFCIGRIGTELNSYRMFVYVVFYFLRDCIVGLEQSERFGVARRIENFICGFECW